MVNVLKRISIKKLVISFLLLLVAFLIYYFPPELKKHISEYNNKTAFIYLIDKNNYVSMTKMITNSKTVNERIKEIINSLIINSNYKKYLPKGFKAIIPEKTKLLDYSLENGLLKLNFNKYLLNISSQNEEKMIQSITYSLTTIKEVKKIMIFIEGQQLTKLPHSKKNIGLYLDRNYGINKIYNIDTFKNIDSYTVYYLGKNENEYYYIPVTYFKDNPFDKVEMIIESLTTAPINNNGLVSHINYQVKLMNYELINDNLSLNFNELLLQSVTNGKINEEVKYAIFYSLFDSLGINEISFQVNSSKIDDFRLEN